MFNEQTIEELKLSLEMDLHELIELTHLDLHLLMYKENDTILVVIEDLEDGTQAVAPLAQSKLETMSIKELNNYINHVWNYGAYL